MLATFYFIDSGLLELLSPIKYEHGGINLLKFCQLFFVTFLIINASQINKSYSQDLVDDISSPIELGDSAEMFTETIRIIGRSRKVFILTNTNQMLNKGDFITLVLNQRDAVARALVAKSHDGSAGIKILKVYSLKRWALMRKNLDLKILKGDDSALFKKVVPKKSVEEDDEQFGINSEEDLYNDSNLMGEDLDLLGNNTRLIKPDNLVSAGYSQYTFKNTIKDDEITTGNQWSGGWAYQFADNIWFEGIFGTVTLDSIPVESTQTVISNYTFRLKYTFQAPLYSYFMPYVGFQIISVSSPQAGDTSVVADADAENELIDSLKTNQIVAGITILRRLVPGWFIQLDLGNDILRLGFAIEF